MPWKLVEDPNALFYFYSFIGSIFGPILGIMLSSFYIERKMRINLDNIYVEPGMNGQYENGYNLVAVGVLLISFALPMSGAFFRNSSLLVSLNDFAFFSGLIISFVLYTIFYRFSNAKDRAVTNG